MATILITGAAGSIGTKLQRHFHARGDHLRLLDLAPSEEVEAADLAAWDDRWARRFAGVDAVIHLAGNAWPTASWASAQRDNIDLTMNVYEAAVRSGVRRLVFASSNWVMAGHRFADGPLHPAADPWPVNAYGVSKLVGERLGRSYSERWGMSVVCLRIGHCQHVPSNLPGPAMEGGSWGQLMWLSDADLCQGFAKAVDAQADLGFAVLNLMSANPGSRWDLEPTRTAIGYVAIDGSPATVDARIARQEEVARGARALIEATERFLAEQDW